VSDQAGPSNDHVELWLVQKHIKEAKQLLEDLTLQENDIMQRASMRAEGEGRLIPPTTVMVLSRMALARRVPNADKPKEWILRLRPVTGSANFILDLAD
jgi:hypothetical protein